MSRPRISVAISTRNRAQTLASTLEGFVAAAARVRAPWELLLVDNASEDGTPAVFERFASRLPVRTLRAPIPGLARGRNVAREAFRGDWLVYTDDDALLDPNWLIAIDDAIDAHEDMDYFGGRCLSRWRGTAPAWLGDPCVPYLQGLLGHYDLGERDRPLTRDDLPPFGVSMGFRRALLEALGDFRVDLGAGTGTRGEDSEYLRRAAGRGYRGWYLADALLYHLAEPARFTPLALYRHGVEKGRTERRLGATQRGSRLREMDQLLRAIWQAGKGRGDWMRVCLVNAGIERGLRADAN